MVKEEKEPKNFCTSEFPISAQPFGQSKSHNQSSINEEVEGWYMLQRLREKTDNLLNIFQSVAIRQYASL